MKSSGRPLGVPPSTTCSSTPPPPRIRARGPECRSMELSCMRAFALLLVALVLVSCGGGGGHSLPYSSTQTPSPPTPTPAPTGTPGVPTSILVSGPSACFTGNVQNGFTMPDVVPVTLAAIPVDATGNLLVGAGAPTVTVASNSTALGVTPLASSPDSFTLTGNPALFS